jgi:hypothetical protein
MRWSESASAQDWTEEALAAIRGIYAHATPPPQQAHKPRPKASNSTRVPAACLYPLAKHLDALQWRGNADVLSAKCLQILREALTSTNASVLLDPLRAKFREKKLTAADIAPW